MESRMRTRASAWGGVALVAVVLLAAVCLRGIGSDAAGAVDAAVTAAPESPEAARRALPPGARSALLSAPVHEGVPTNVELDDERAMALWQRQFQAAAAERVAMLLERGDARSLYEALLLLPGSGALDDDDYGRDRQAILDRARALAPDDPHLALVAAIDCGSEECDRAAAIDELLRLQPDNALGALLALDAALEAGDPAAIERWLARAAAAGHYDLGYTRTARDYAWAFGNVPAPTMDAETVRRTVASWGLEVEAATSADDLVTSNAMGVALAHALPSMVGLSDLCSARRVSSARLATCHRIWRHMAASDTAIAQAFALPQLVQMTGDATARRHWQERLRHFSWLMQEAGRITDLQAARDHVRLGEIQAWERLLKRRGITMPAGWLPDHPRHRSLILTGRPPPGD